MIFPVLADKLAELRREARYDGADLNLGLGPSQIERIAKRLKSRFGAAEVELECPNELRERWLTAVRSGTQLELKQREVRLLSWYADIGTSHDFITFVSERFSKVPRGIVRGVLASYANVWHRANRDAALNRQLESWLLPEKIKGKLSWWVECTQFWLDNDAPTHIAASIKKGLMSSEAVAKEFRAPAASMLVTAALSAAAVEMAESAANLTTEEVDYLLDRLIQEPLIDLRSLHLTAHTLISSKRAEEREDFRNRIVNALLTHPLFGDPRIDVANWQSPDLFEARSVFLGWLSVEDIRTFFEVILTPGSDKHGRKDFWLRYERKIKMSRVFVSNMDARRRREQLEDLASRGRQYGGVNGSTSVFVLDLGSVVAVEFSAVGNALYLYTKHNFRRIMPDMLVPQTKLSLLKDAELAIPSRRNNKGAQRYQHRAFVGFSHVDGWQSTVQRELETHGIYADS